MYGVLDGHRVVPVDDALVWGRWFETAERHVADQHLYLLGLRWPLCEVRVSTVCLGLDHGFLGPHDWRGTEGLEREAHCDLPLPEPLRD